MTGARPTVFVVDDDPSVRRGLGRLLRSAGYRVEVFESAQDFLGEADVDAGACLILDVRLPGLDGFDLQERLRARGSTIPIIFITGHGDPAMQLRAMKAGAVDFLHKPFDERALFVAVRDALARPRDTGPARG